MTASEPTSATASGGDPARMGGTGKTVARTPAAVDAGAEAHGDRAAALGDRARTAQVGGRDDRRREGRTAERLRRAAVWALTGPEQDQSDDREEQQCRRRPDEQLTGPRRAELPEPGAPAEGPYAVGVGR